MNRHKFRKNNGLVNIFTMVAVVVIGLYILIHSVDIINLGSIGKSIGDYAYHLCENVVNSINTKSSPVRSFVADDEGDDWGNKICKKILGVLPIYTYVDDYIAKSEYGEYMFTDADWFETELNANDISKLTSSSAIKDPVKDTTKNNIQNAAKVNSTPVSSGAIYSKKQLQNTDFILSKLYTVSGTTYFTKKDIDPLVFSQMDMKLKQTDNKKPQILIYHTHSQEGFTDTVEGDKSTTILEVGNYLTAILEKMGYNVIHDTTCYDLIDGKLDRSAAYDYARKNVIKILKENPSVEVVLDVHRDGVKENMHLATEINGKQTARIMFFNGLSRIKDIGDVDHLYNKNLKSNLAFSLQMRLKSLEYYPNFVRTNYLNAYKYNLDLRPKSMLVEVGAQTNSLQEVKNAMEPLAVLLDKVLKGK